MLFVQFRKFFICFSLSHIFGQWEQVSHWPALTRFYSNGLISLTSHLIRFKGLHKAWFGIRRTVIKTIQLSVISQCSQIIFRRSSTLMRLVLFGRQAHDCHVYLSEYFPTSRDWEYLVAGREEVDLINCLDVPLGYTIVKHKYISYIWMNNHKYSGIYLLNYFSHPLLSSHIEETANGSWWVFLNDITRGAHL